MFAISGISVGVGLGGPVPYQRGLVPHQSQRSRYSNRTVSNSNKAVTAIREAMQTMKLTDEDLGFELNEGLSSHASSDSVDLYLLVSFFSSPGGRAPAWRSQVRFLSRDLLPLLFP